MQTFGKGQYSGDVVSASGDGGVTACVTTYQRSNFNQSLHYHDNSHISFVLHGGCQEKKKDRYERLPGKLTCYYAGEPHQVMQTADQSRHVNIEIGPEFFRDYEISESAMFNALFQNPDAKFLMLNIYREIGADEFSDTSIHLLLLDLVHKSARSTAGNQVPLWVKSVKEQLHESWNQVISLDQLAYNAGVHPVTISKYFPKYFACTLGEYMRKLKIEKSLALIKLPDASMTSVAYACGFADQSHFIRSFKQCTGFLPANYKKL